MHRKFEEQFWGTKMALSNGTKLSSGAAPPEYSIAALTETKRKMEDFLADSKKLERTRELLKSGDLSPEQRKVLTLFERTFKCYIMENADAKRLREEATKIEGTLEDARNKFALKISFAPPPFVLNPPALSLPPHTALRQIRSSKVSRPPLHAALGATARGSSPI